MLATYVNEDHNNWDENLHLFALCLRTSVNDTTGVSPALLNLGREIQLPIDRQLSQDTSQHSEEAIRSLISAFPNSLKHIITAVRDRIRRKHQINKVYYDKKRREVEFDIGQQVWVLNHPQSSAPNHKCAKFEPKFIGPYKILHKSNDTYTLDMPKKMVPKRHVSQLKLYYPPEQEAETENVAETSTTDESDNPPTQNQSRTLRPRQPINYKEKDRRKRN